MFPIHWLISAGFTLINFIINFQQYTFTFTDTFTLHLGPYVASLLTGTCRLKTATGVNNGCHFSHTDMFFPFAFCSVQYRAGYIHSSPARLLYYSLLGLCLMWKIVLFWHIAFFLYIQCILQRIELLISFSKMLAIFSLAQNVYYCRLAL